MPQLSKHPPKPVLTYRVGVAGTLDLSFADPGLANRIGEFLRFVRKRVLAVGDDNKDYFAEDQPRLILVCSLARGVDQLVADLAVEEGYILHVPLAYPRQTYIEKNFSGYPEAQAAFERLWNIAEAGLELSGDPSAPESEAYGEAGSILVANSDLLLAVWNFGPGRGDGGTASSVEKARDAGLLVARMRPDRAEGPFFFDDDTDKPCALLRGEIRRQLLPGITPADPADDVSDSDEDRTIERERKRLAGFYREREWRFDWGWPSKIANAVLSFTWPKLTIRLPSYADRAKHAWPAVMDAGSPDSAREHFRSFDQWADGLAVFYGNCTRSTVAVTVLLGAGLLAYSLAVKLWPNSGLNYAFPAFEGVSILLLTALVGVARLCSVHAKWLQYRMLSEFLRCAGLASAIGGLPLPHARFREKDEVSHTWVSFYFQAVVRGMGLLTGVFDADALADFRLLLIDRLGGQIDFHRGRQKLYHRIDRNIRAGGIFVFVVSLAGALLQIAMVLWKIEQRIPYEIPRHLANLSQVFPIFGGALAAFVSQESFGRLSHLSGTIARRLGIILRKVENAPLMNRAELREATERAIDEMMAEHEEWFTLYSLRDIELPH
jgi:hypothetical protein